MVQVVCRWSAGGLWSGLQVVWLWSVVWSAGGLLCAGLASCAGLQAVAVQAVLCGAVTLIFELQGRARICIGKHKHGKLAERVGGL